MKQSKKGTVVKRVKWKTSVFFIENVTAHRAYSTPIGIYESSSNSYIYPADEDDICSVIFCIRKEPNEKRKSKKTKLV